MADGTEKRGIWKDMMLVGKSVEVKCGVTVDISKLHGWTKDSIKEKKLNKILKNNI